jgi:hypothetical protein
VYGRPRRPWRSLAGVLSEIVISTEIAETVISWSEIAEVAAEIAEVQVAQLRIWAVLAAGAGARREEPG